MTKGPYVPEPQAPAEVQERLSVVLAVLRGELTVTAAAQQLKVSRNHFQSLLHKAQAGLITGLLPGMPGRPPTPAREVELQHKVQVLERENQQLRERVETIDRLMGVAGEILRGQVRPRGRSSGTKKKAESSGGTNEGEDPDGAEARLAGARRLRGLGLNGALAAAIVGAGASTVRRWALCEKRGVRRPSPRRRSKPIDESARAAALAVLRSLHGSIGAEALSHRIPELTRRQAAAVKHDALAQMERERLAQLTRIRVTACGVMRGMDQLHVRCEQERAVLLIASDAHAPYRTAAVPAARYDEETVARLIELDIEHNGAPLVYRMDRASSHRTPRIAALLAEHCVLTLHGPAHYPQYYGQHERQNRDHRAWLRGLVPEGVGELDRMAAVMLDALNREWPRRSLNWSTPHELWSARKPLNVDREALHDEVEQRAAGLRAKLEGVHDEEELAWRLAIEQALINRRYLTRQAGGWC